MSLTIIAGIAEFAKGESGKNTDLELLGAIGGFLLFVKKRKSI